MILADIKDGVVSNTIVVSPENIPEWAKEWPEVTGDAGIGWGYVDGRFVEPEPEQEEGSPPPPLTALQLIIGLVKEGWISEADGDAWLDGTPPPQVDLLISQMPVGERFEARARAKRFTSVERNDPMVEGLGMIAGKSPEELDAFFWEYSQI